MIAKYRFALTLGLVLVFSLQLVVIGVFFLLVGLDTEEAQRAQFGQMLAHHKALLAALALMLLFALGIGLKALFNAYPAPITRLTEDVVLLAANPGHRVAPQSARSRRKAQCAGDVLPGAARRPTGEDRNGGTVDTRVSFYPDAASEKSASLLRARRSHAQPHQSKPARCG